MGQGKIQKLGYLLCILIEHLIEVTQAKKEHLVLMLFLDLKILTHHRRHFLKINFCHINRYWL